MKTPILTIEWNGKKGIVVLHPNNLRAASRDKALDDGIKLVNMLRKK